MRQPRQTRQQASQHEKILRFRVTGEGVDADRFGAWIGPEAQNRGLDGWVRTRGADVDVLLAGDTFGVDSLVFLAGQIVEVADGALDVQDLRGDEPIWSGFHVLPAL